MKLKLEQIQALTDEDLRMRIAELLKLEIVWCNKKHLPSPDGEHACLKVCEGGGWYSYEPIPKYPHDLNACHEMEKAMGRYGERCWYAGLLQGKLGNLDWGFATARQRCEAFVLTMGGA